MPEHRNRIPGGDVPQDRNPLARSRSRSREPEPLQDQGGDGSAYLLCQVSRERTEHQRRPRKVVEHSFPVEMSTSAEQRSVANPPQTRTPTIGHGTDENVDQEVGGRRHRGRRVADLSENSRLLEISDCDPAVRRPERARAQANR